MDCYICTEKIRDLSDSNSLRVLGKRVDLCGNCSNKLLVKGVESLIKCASPGAKGQVGCVYLAKTNNFCKTTKYCYYQIIAGTGTIEEELETSG